MLLRTDMESFRPTEKKLSMEDIQVFFWQLLIFLMLFIPRGIQEIKTTILGLLLFLTIAQIIKYQKIKFNREVAIVITLFLSYALLSSLIGTFRANPGVSGFFRVNVIYYIIFTILITCISDMKLFMRILKTIILTSNFIALYSIILLLVELGVWPETLFIKFDVTSNVGIHTGFTHLVNTNLSMLIFTAPLVTILYGEKYSSDYISRLLVSINNWWR